jgi:hypothetical protein
MQKSLIIRSLACTAILVLVFFILDNTLSGSVWEGMVVSQSAVVGEYCEYDHAEQFFRQKVNTYSNLIYFFFGMWICLIAREDVKSKNTQNKLASFPALSLLLGICFIYLSFGSAFFHASLTWVGQRIDMNGVYGLSLTLMGIGFYHVFGQKNLSESQKKGFISILVVLILAFYQVHLMIPSRILLPIMILLIWVLTVVHYFQFRKQRSIWLALASILLIVIALKIRQDDVDKINCDPHSLWQGHSVWHLLAGLSSFCGYAFFRFSKEEVSKFWK